MISDVVSGDEGPSKPAPDLVERALDRAGSAHAFLVGDAVWDVESAARAGIPCVGVLTGGYSEAELRDAGAVAVHDTPREVAAALSAGCSPSSPLVEEGRQARHETSQGSATRPSVS